MFRIIVYRLVVIAKAHRMLMSKILFALIVLNGGDNWLWTNLRTVRIWLLVLGLGAYSAIGSASSDFRAWAQEPSISGTIAIEFGNDYTRSEIVTVELVCSSTFEADCNEILVAFENNDANLDSESIDVIPNINVSSTTDSTLITAFEEDINSGIFTLVFDNEPADEFGTSIRFVDDESITISNIPLSQENGVKNITAIFLNNFDQFASAEDIIILDTIPPEIPSLIEPEYESFTNDTSPTFDWSDAIDANPIAYYAIELDDEESFEPPLIMNAILERSSSEELDLSGLSLADGTYFWRVAAVDVAGNVGQFTEIFLFSVDTIPPPAPVIIYPEIETTIFEGSPIINGTSEPLSTVYIFEGDTMLGATTSDRTGVWSLDLFSLDYGSHSITSIAQDGAGNRSPPAFTVVTIEQFIPTPFSITIESSSNPQLIAGRDSIIIFGEIQMEDIPPATFVVVDWDDGTAPSRIQPFENTWNATHSYSSDQIGLKRIVARLFVDEVEQATSAPLEITLLAPPAQEPTGFFPDAELLVPIIIASVVAPAALLGIRFYRSSKKKQTQSSPNIRIAFDYGIRNQERDTVRRPEIVSKEGVAELEENCRATLTNALTQAKEALNQAKQITDVANFCMEAKEDPDRFFSRISNMALIKMLEYVQPFYSRMFVDEISTHCDLEIVGKDKRASFDINIRLRPIEPYIEVALLINETKTSSLTLTFKIDSEVSIKKLELKQSPAGIQKNLDSAAIDLRFSLQSISVTNMNKPVGLGSNDNLLDRTIELWKGKFEIKGLSMTEKSKDEKLDADTSHGAEREVAEIVCPACQKHVLASMFCPECGAAINK